MLGFLYYLGRDWRDEPTLSRLRWVLALLVADVVLRLGYAAGFQEQWVNMVSEMLLVDPWLAGRVLWSGILVVHLAMVAQMLRVLAAAREAIAGGSRDVD